MREVLLVVICLFMLCTRFMSNTQCIGNLLSIPWESTILYTHNNLRSKIAHGEISSQPPGSNIEYLIWDYEISRVAQEYAKCCSNFINNNIINSINKSSLQFYGDFNKYKFTENLGYFSYNSSDNPSTDYSFLSKIQNMIITQWFSQYKYYTYPYLANNSNFNYYNMIHGTTRYIGCGVSICPLFQASSKEYYQRRIFVVCNYFPTYADNWTGNFDIIYNKTNNNNLTCSNCPINRKSCVDNLCYGCPDPNYFECQNADLCDKFSVCYNENVTKYCPGKCNLNCSNISSSNPSTCPEQPTLLPTIVPTENPMLLPTTIPTTIKIPTLQPILFPTSFLTKLPISFPTIIPTSLSTSLSTSLPTKIPTKIPTKFPTSIPTIQPLCLQVLNLTEWGNWTQCSLPCNQKETQNRTRKLYSFSCENRSKYDVWIAYEIRNCSIENCPN